MGSGCVPISRGTLVFLGAFEKFVVFSLFCITINVVVWLCPAAFLSDVLGNFHLV